MNAVIHVNALTCKQSKYECMQLYSFFSLPNTPTHTDNTHTQDTTQQRQRSRERQGLRSREIGERSLESCEPAVGSMTTEISNGLASRPPDIRATLYKHTHTQTQHTYTLTHSHYLSPFPPSLPLRLDLVSVVSCFNCTQTHTHTHTHTHHTTQTPHTHLAPLKLLTAVLGREETFGKTHLRRTCERITLSFVYYLLL
jgi:hypothetical protein